MAGAPVAIYGAGQQGVVVWDCLTTTGRDVVAFIDDGKSGMLQGLPILPDVNALAPDVEIALAIGNNRARRAKFLALKEAGRRIASVIHPTASVALTAALGEGVTLLQQSVVCAAVTVGDGTILDVRTLVAHNSVVDRFCHLVACSVGARCRIGEGSFVAPGSYVINDVTLGAWCECGAGSLVTHDVAEENSVVGWPARRIKKN